MPNRILKDSIYSSPNFNKLSAEGERHFYRCLLQTDDYGCFEATPAVILGRCYPLKLGEIQPADVEQWFIELGEAGILGFWEESGRLFARFESFDKHNAKYAVTADGKPTRHRRKTPCPLDVCQSLPPFASVSQTLPDRKTEPAFASLCQHLPNPNPNHNPDSLSTREADSASPSSAPQNGTEVSYFLEHAHGTKEMAEPDIAARKFAGVCATNGLDVKAEIDGLSRWARDSKNALQVAKIQDWGRWHIDKLLQKCHQRKNQREALAGVGDGF